jgi:energy-coupling factor transport system substrate-specific component
MIPATSGKFYSMEVAMQERAMQSEKRSSWLNIGKDFTTMTWVLIPVAIAINIAIGQIVFLLKVPVYLDMIGTVLVGILCGPWAGAVTGALSNTIWGLFNPDSLPWWPVALFIGLVAGLCANAGLFKSWWKVILSGFLIALTAAIVSTPIAVYLYGGITASGSSFITAYLLQTGQGVVSSVLSTGFLVEPVDKITTATLAFAIVQGLSRRLLARFPRPENAEAEAGNNATQLVIALIVAVIVVALGFLVRNMLAG